MSVRGIKRPLSDIDKQNSPEDLMLLQPVCDSEDDSSPECVLSVQPVTDPYSSDDSSQQITLQKQTSPNNKDMAPGNDQTKILSKIQDCSAMKGEHVLFFLNVDFTPMMPEVGLENASTEDCLYHLFQFVSDSKAERRAFKFHNKSMEEIRKFYFTETSLSWLAEYDDINYKTILPEDTADKENYFIKMERPRKTDNYCVFYAHSVLTLYNFCQLLAPVIQATIKEDKKYLQLKNNLVMDVLENLSLIVHPRSFKQNGVTIEFPLEIRPRDISENSPLVADTDVKIITKPDGVYVINAGNEGNASISKIVIEVYCPSDENIVEQKDSPTTDGKMFSPGRHRISHKTLGKLSPEQFPSPSAAVYLPAGLPTFTKTVRESSPVKFLSPKPKKKKDGIVDPEYQNAGREYIGRSLPRRCRDAGCVDRMAGQHIVQLFAQAFVNRPQHSNHNAVVLESVGMFFINEFIYFSKLHVKSKILDMLNGRNYVNTDDLLLEVQRDVYYENNPPTVQFSNFCLDITVPSHRHALAMFLREYLFEQMLQNNSQ